MTDLSLRILKTVIRTYPQVIPYLRGRARFAAAMLRPEGFKTYEYFLQQLEGLIRGVYDGNVGGEFIDVTANLISGQLNQAFQQAWQDEGMTDELMPDYLTSAAEDMILGQYDFVDQLYRDIADARNDHLFNLHNPYLPPIEEVSLNSLLARAALWARRWTEAYNLGVQLIVRELGGKLEWIEGDTVEKCFICVSLNGIVAFAREWDELGVRPQNAPNPALAEGCGGWRCACELRPTDKRRSPKAFDTILNLTTR